MFWFFWCYTLMLELYCLVAQIQQAEILFQFFNTQSLVFFAGGEFWSLVLLQLSILCLLKLGLSRSRTSLLFLLGSFIGLIWVLLLLSFTDFTSITFLDATLPLYLPQFNAWLGEFYIYALHCGLLGYLMSLLHKHPTYSFRLFLLSYALVIAVYYLSGLLVATVLASYIGCEALLVLQEIRRVVGSR